eukprot:456594_1
MKKICDEGDELKGDLMKLFKQREHTLDLADFIERLRFTNRDLSVTIQEHKTSHEKREGIKSKDDEKAKNSIEFESEEQKIVVLLKKTRSENETSTRSSGGTR